MKTTLIHYPADNRMILVSDEKIKEGDTYMFGNVVLKSDGGYKRNCRKVIAKDNSEIDLSQEVSDALGIVDVNLLVDLEIIERKITFISDALLKLFKMDWIAGFQKAQELNKKMFTEEYMKEAIIYGEARGVSLHYGEKVESYEDYISSLQSPKEYEVEVEMQEVEDYVGFAGHTSYPTFSHIPKITNNKIKVLTIKHHSLTPNKKNNEKKNSYHKHTN